jgi:predicted TIM-barrel enzyme
MGKTFAGSEINTRLRESLATGRPLLATIPGCGLNAKLAEVGGADIIALLYTGMVRQRGLPSIAQLDEPLNAVVRRMFPEQFNATQEIPICCGIDVSEMPADGNLGELLDSFLDMGFSGVVNFPTSGLVSSSPFVAMATKGEPREDYEKVQRKGELDSIERCRRNEENGVGYSREVELIRLCNERDIFTLVYVFTPEQAAEVARSGADCICGHCGGTTGGLVGHKVTLDYQSAAKRLQDLFDAATAVNPGILLFGHGGPFALPHDTEEMYRLTSAHGFLAGSSVDRIPVEEAIIARVREFKSVAMCRTARATDVARETHIKRSNNLAHLR